MGYMGCRERKKRGINKLSNNCYKTSALNVEAKIQEASFIEKHLNLNFTHNCEVSFFVLDSEVLPVQGRASWSG